MRVNALVVDLALLGPTAWDFLEKLTETMPGLGVVVCTGRSTVAQRVRGLRMGADDWVTKPCHPEEVLARVEAVVRRRKQAAGRADDGPVVAGDLEIRADQFQAFAGGRSVDLTRREFEVLQLLAHAEGKVLQREEIYQQVWGYAMAHGDRSVDVFIRKVRQKLEGASPEWKYIHTHFGVGYRFDPELRDEQATAPRRRPRASSPRGRPTVRARPRPTSTPSSTSCRRTSPSSGGRVGPWASERDHARPGRSAISASAAVPGVGAVLTGDRLSVHLGERARGQLPAEPGRAVQRGVGAALGVGDRPRRSRGRAARRWRRGSRSPIGCARRLHQQPASRRPGPARSGSARPARAGRPCRAPSSPPVRSSIAMPAAAAAAAQLAHALGQLGDVGHEVARARVGWPPRSACRRRRPGAAARRSRRAWPGRRPARAARGSGARSPGASIWAQIRPLSRRFRHRWVTRA